MDDPVFPLKRFEELVGMSAFMDRRLNGVAPSRTPLEDVRCTQAELPDDTEAGVQRAEARISARLDGVRVLNLYVPNGSSVGSEKYRHKLDWLSCLQRPLAAIAERDEPLCVVGDFNIAPEARDIHDPERLTGGLCPRTPNGRFGPGHEWPAS